MKTNKKEIERLISTLSVQTSSREEDLMIKYIENFLSSIPNTSVVVSNNNIYVCKGDLKQGESYPCVVAHTDTVHDIHKDFSVFQAGDCLFAFSQDDREQVGVGGDDKSGIWIALEMILKKDNIKGVFFWGEEIGCLGSSEADESFFIDVGYCIQCDRRGNKDFVTSIYSDVLVSQEFKDVVLPIMTKHGYEEADGATTDVYKLKESINVSMVNMSCGYYQPHTDQETVSIVDSIDCLSFVDDLIKSLGMNKYEHKMEKSYNIYGGAWHSRDTVRDYSSPYSSVGNVERSDFYTNNEQCTSCYSDVKFVEMNKQDIDLEFCPYCDVEWEDGDIALLSPTGASVVRLNNKAYVWGTYYGDEKVTDYYYSYEDDEVYHWTDVVVHSDKDLMGLRERHEVIHNPNQEKLWNENID
tara:strand:+ start:257 stop:1492 length:1236 start_codon:yes stop_codon:yes gene_type:complete